MTKEDIDRWLADYIAAWKTYDSDQIAALFTEDISYRYHPYDDPIDGRDEVVKAWREEGDHPEAGTRDEPGTFQAQYSAVAVDGDVAPRPAGAPLQGLGGRPGRPDLRQLLRDALR